MIPDSHNAVEMYIKLPTCSDSGILFIGGPLFCAVKQQVCWENTDFS